MMQRVYIAKTFIPAVQKAGYNALTASNGHTIPVLGLTSISKSLSLRAKYVMMIDTFLFISELNS